MREINTHKTNTANEELSVMVHDEPGPGGANHYYTISGFDSATNPSTSAKFNGLTLLFQNGAIKEAGVNGITHEALLAILIDRLQGFQAGPYKCKDNEEALYHLERALSCLHRRTLARVIRGVEGTMEV